MKSICTSLIFLCALSLPGDTMKLENDLFSVAVDEQSGGIMSLRRVGDRYNTEYVIGKQVKPEFDIPDSRWLGDILFVYTRGTNTTVRTASTSLSDDSRRTAYAGMRTVSVQYLQPSTNACGIRDFSLKEEYKLEKDSLTWSFTIKNTSDVPLTFSEIGLPLLFNQFWPHGQNEVQKKVYENCVLRHSAILLDNSYYIVQRPNGVGPFLLVTPLGGTRVEMFKRFGGKGTLGIYNTRKGGVYGMTGLPDWEGLYIAYVHGSLDSHLGQWFLPLTDLHLTHGEQKTYGFTFRWTDNDAHVRETLYEAGFIDITVVPGMVVPCDLLAKVALRTKKTVHRLVPQFPYDTRISPAVTNGTHLVYTIEFSHTGQNLVMIEYGDNKIAPLQFFVTDPLKTVIHNRAAFIEKNQVQRDPDKLYPGAFLPWEWRDRRMLRQETDPEAPHYFTSGADDIGFANPLFLSLKNVTYPEPKEIKALVYYLSTHIWNNMQRTNDYAIYRWFPVPKEDETSRAMDYPHLMNIYYHMYLIEKLHGNTGYLTAREYLERSCRTALAFFTLKPMFFDGAITQGNMGESGLALVIDALRDEGMTREANTLNKFWRAKADAFEKREYPFASEMFYDSTAFEAVYGIASRYDKKEMMESVTAANIANRGRQPVWYHYGSDNRFISDSHYQLSYMTQLGGWALLDYAVYHVNNPAELLRLAYGSYLASWASVQPSSDSQPGAAGWVFHNERGPDGMDVLDGEIGLGLYGALRAAASVVIDDPLFGLTGYGCAVTRDGKGTLHITPKDGLQRRIHIIPGFHLEINRDCIKQFAVNRTFTAYQLSLENITGTSHETILKITGLKFGTYTVSGVKGTATVTVKEDTPAEIKLILGTEGDHVVKIRKG